MTFYREEWPLSDKPVWMTIGNFDGFHRGHIKSVEQLKKNAKEAGAASVILTFWPHPRVYLQNITTPFYLSTLAEKKAELTNTGVDQVAILKFDDDLASLYAEGFFAELSRHIDLKGLVVGENFALGKDRSGSMDVIKRICDRKKIELSVVEPELSEGLPISSGRIRKALGAGDVEAAEKLLGRPYSLTSRITQGMHRGSKLGFPTANQIPDPMKLLPKWGVYATLASFDSEMRIGATSVGVRPTFEDTKVPNIETLLLDFDGNIYNEELNVAFKRYLRAEKKFDTIEDLIRQIQLDAEQARKLLTDEPSP